MSAKITIYNVRLPAGYRPPVKPAACSGSVRERRGRRHAEVERIRTGHPIQYGSSDGKYRPYANRLSEPTAEELRLGAVFHQALMKVTQSPSITA